MRFSRLLSTLLISYGAWFADSSLLALPKTLVYCSEGSPSSFNPQVATDGATFNVTRHIYDKLVQFKHGSTEIEPGLATRWDISADGLIYTFHLRDGVQFHETAYFKPSRTLNADDVLFSFNRQRLKDHPYYMVGGGTYEYFSSMDMPNIIRDIRKVDDHTVQFVLHKAEAPFLADLAMDYASILSAEYADQLLKSKRADYIDIEPVGTGPFFFRSYQKDQLVRLYRHPNYWRAPAKLERLVFSITQEPTVRYQKLKTAECHFATEPAPQDIQAMAAHPALKVMEQAGLNVGYLSFNVKKKPFDNVLVRQAIHLALNRQAYINAVYLKNATVAKNPIPPTIWSYNDAVKDYPYDVAQAKELLTKAGYPNGFSTTLWTLPVSRPYNPNGKKMGEMMQADLAKIGIQAKLVTFDWPTYLKKAKEGEHEMLQMGWTGDNGDPDNFLNVLLGCAAISGGSNYSGWCNKEFNALIDKARQLSKQSERAKLYEEAQVVFKREAPWVTLAHSKVYRAMRKNVVGYKIDPFGGDSFYEVDLVDSQGDRS